MIWARRRRLKNGRRPGESRPVSSNPLTCYWHVRKKNVAGVSHRVTVVSRKQKLSDANKSLATQRKTNTHEKKNNDTREEIRQSRQTWAASQSPRPERGRCRCCQFCACRLYSQGCCLVSGAAAPSLHVRGIRGGKRARRWEYTPVSACPSTCMRVHVDESMPGSCNTQCAACADVEECVHVHSCTQKYNLHAWIQVHACMQMQCLTVLH